MSDEVDLVFLYDFIHATEHRKGQYFTYGNIPLSLPKCRKHAKISNLPPLITLNVKKGFLYRVSTRQEGSKICLEIAKADAQRITVSNL